MRTNRFCAVAEWATMVARMRAARIAFMDGLFFHRKRIGIRHLFIFLKYEAFQPYIPASETRPELTFRALLLGSLFGILFGAVTVYVGLRAGLTVAASIPIAVLSISVLRALGRASILENNIVQTTGNAGQSIASGVIFTLPALVFLG